MLEGETAFRLVYMQKFRSGYQVEKGYQVVGLPSGEGKQDEIVGL